MTSRRWFRSPLCLLLLVTALLAFVVQSGELGTADTMHRLQSTHALWTSEPPVFPQEYPEFGVHGRGGKAAELVRHRAIPAHAARRHRRHIHRAPSHLRRLRRQRPQRPRHHRQLQHQHSRRRAHCACLFPLPAPAGLRRKTIHPRRPCSRVLHNPSALHAEHDGEQLHLSAHADRILVSVRMAAHRQPPRSAHRLCSTRTEPAHSPHNRPGSPRRRPLHPARAVA